jgi:anti-sigma regulatory factor (Ser/Thr protein kinase)
VRSLRSSGRRPREFAIHAEQTLAPDPHAPAVARASVREVCDPVAPHLVDDAALLVSELVTNAVRHGEAPVTLLVDCDPAGITVVVQDAGQTLPAIRRTSRRIEGGRGLQLVSRIAADWGVRPTARGKQVWFRLA